MTDTPQPVEPNRPRLPLSDKRLVRAPLPRWTVPTVAVVVLVASVIVLAVLWRWIDTLTLADGEKKATAQLDAIKIAASIAVGGGGLFALYLAARRQRTQELELMARYAELAQRDRAQNHTEEVAQNNRLHAERIAADAREDATARRITELYIKAAEQLGSEKAAVRLAGLYALERLAQDNLTQRQTVVNVLCAYLRMPYADDNAPNNVDAGPAQFDFEHIQEREVRLTIQGILTSHLRPGNDIDNPLHTFWPDIDLDLTGAMLTSFNLAGGHLRHARFSGARFIDSAKFAGVRFDKTAWFDDAHFAADATFGGATFAGPAIFSNVDITGKAGFGGVNFASNARFPGAKFVGDAGFGGSSFAGNASFNEAHFATKSWFNDVKFTGDAAFEATRFLGPSFFDKAQFVKDAHFRGASFAAFVKFSSANFTGSARFEDADFAAYASFGDTVFTSTVTFDRARFTRGVHMDGTVVRVDGSGLVEHDHRWPNGWALAGQAAPENGQVNLWRSVIKTSTYTDAYDLPRSDG